MHCFGFSLSDTFPGLLQYIEHISFNLFIQSPVKYIPDTEIPFLLYEKNLRLTEKTPGSNLEKRYRKDSDFQASLYKFSQ